MIYQAKDFFLKDGTKVTLKTPEISDAQKLLDNIIEISASTDYLLSTPKDYDIYLQDMSKEEGFIQSSRDGKDYLICAYVNDEIIANCALRVFTHEKDSHRANLGIAINPKYQGRGLGSLMFDEMIRIAKETPELDQLELGVIAKNERARRLYLKKGFVKTGDIPHELKLKDCTYLDGETMVLFLKK